MKKFITMMIMVLAVVVAMAQAPEKFSYQAVVRNASNALVTNAPVGVRVSILQGSANGNAVYVETQTATTNANGLLTIEIGGGSTLQGSFASIDWANGPFFLKTESDPAGGSNYTVTSTQQLMSVPYALYAKEAANGFSGDYNDLTNLPQIPQVPANVSAFSNDAGYITAAQVPEQVNADWNATTGAAEILNKPTIPTVPANVSAFTNDAGYVTSADIPNVPTNVSAFTNDVGYLTSFTEQQVLSISHDTLFLTGGSFVKLPDGFDGDYNSLTNKPELFSGDYNDLTNKPNLFSGSYNDLTNKPTNADFGQALVRGTVNNPAGATDISVTFINYSLMSGGLVSIIFARNVPAGASLNINDQGAKPILWRGAALTDGVIKANDRCLFMYNSGANSYYLLAIDRWGVDIDALAAVARTGSYNDLSDKPTIPTVPTDVSAFNNDAGYITMDSVPAVPTNVSAFTNDAGYLTSFTEQQVLSISHDTLFLTGGSYVRLPNGFSGDYNDLTNKPNLFSGSYNDLTNKPTNADFGQALVRGTVNNPAGATDIAVTFINYSLMSGGLVSIIFARNVPAGASLNINDQGAKPILWRGAALTDGVIKANDRCLFMYNAAANRFYLLAIDRWGVDIDALAAVARTGSYNDLSDKPTIPTVPTDVSAFNNDAGYITMDSVPAIPTVPTNVSAFTNDAGYITESDIPEIQSVPTNVSQLNNDAGYITMNSIPAGLAGSNTGDIMYWDAATGTWIMMPAGSSGQVLTVENGVPVWANLPDYTTMTLPPTVTTSAPSEVTQATALCGGVVTNDGNVQLTACGVCWNTQHFPTIADAHTENGMDVGAFTAHVEGLAHNTTYYVRAYATNVVGTTYGAEMFFTTADIPSGSVNMPNPCSVDTNTTWHPILNNGSTLCAGTDSVELSLNNYQYGSIQWQYSTDTVSWYNIAGATDAQLIYLPEQTQYVRASVSYANCPPEYSAVKFLQKPPTAYAGVSRTANYGDTLRLQANMEESATGSWQILQGAGGFLSEPNEAYTKFYGTDSLYRLRWTLNNACGVSSDDINVRYVQTTVSDKVVMVDTTDIIFSDSAQMAQGYYVISFSDPNIVIGDSTILVSLINGGFMCMVDSWSMANDSTYAMYTTQATLYDILESGVIQFDAISGESESDSIVQNASPKQEVVYLDHIPTREELRSNPDMTKGGTVYMLRMDMEREDGSRVSLSGPSLRGNSQLRNETEENRFGGVVQWLGGEIFSNIGVKIENVTFTLNATPTFEYDKDLRRLRFGIYGATFYMSADIVPYLTLGHVDVDILEWKPMGDRTAYFAIPVGGIPIPFSLDYGVKLDLKGSLDITETARYRLNANATFTRGVRYYRNSRTFVTDAGHDGSTDIELVSDNTVGTVDLGASISAFLNLKLAALAGPRVQVGYKAKAQYCTGLLNQNIGWQGKLTSDLFVKLDLKAVKLIDPIIPENWSKEWTFLHRERVFPDTMYLYNGNNHTIQNTQASNIVKVKVEGSGGKPIRNTRVYFQPKDGGTVSSGFAFTDQDGIAQTIWTPSPSCAIHQLYAYAYDCEQNPIKGAPVVFTAYEYAGCTSSTLNLRYLLTGNTLTLQASGGDEPYTYSVDGEHFVSLSELPPLSALACYVLSVKDHNGCIRSITYAPPANTNCDWSNLDMDAEFSNGALILQGTGGTPPYQYSLGGISYSTNNVFPSLSPGVYTAYVMDSKGCDYNRSITVEDDDILDLTSYNSQPCAGTSTITDYDGNVYHTIQIGQQCWLKENLRTTHYADGEIIPIGAGCYYPNGDAGNRAQYGLLYTWYTATRNVSSESNPSGVQGACPYGWHVPSDAEWSQLLSQPQLMVCPAKALATKFGWNISTTPCSPGYENWYNNGSGFNAAPAGQYNSGYGDFGAVAWFWSATETHPSYAWTRYLRYDGSGVGRYSFDFNNSAWIYYNTLGDKSRAYSVRCLRD